MRSKKLTSKQENVLEALCKYIEEVGFPPSYRDLMRKLNLSSTSTIKSYLDALKAKGFITFEPGQPRTLKIMKHVTTAS